MGAVNKCASYNVQSKIEVNPKMNRGIFFGQYSVQAQCFNCKNNISTQIQSSPGFKAWITGLLLCFFGCVFCACIPCCCCPEWQEVTHYCPNCNFVLGKYKP